MDKRIKLISKQDCTGCAACHDVCTKNAITMTNDGDIHLFPTIDKDKCVQCGRCMQVCPALNYKPIEENKQHYYYAWSEVLDDRIKSTSGGIGSALMKQAITSGYYVCAPAFDDQWNLEHIITNKSEDIERLRGSKYLQSNTTGVYQRIVSSLKEGNKIFFVGTPCQVAALHSIIPERMQGQVVTCGIICHGVNSSKVWTDYVNYLQEQEGARLLAYNFRSKSKGWGKLRITYSLENGKNKDIPAWNNLFHCWFGHHYILRPSCLRCLYRKEQRNSDVTIGDFWGIEKIAPELETKQGVTALITSTAKGADFVEHCSEISKTEVDGAESAKVLKGYIDRATEEKKQAETKQNAQFKDEYISYPFEVMAKKYPKQSYIGHYCQAIKSRLK